MTGYGAIEYAYYLMAKDSGIYMTECRVMEENGRRHFMTRRFDRTDEGRKLHMQSLGAMAHFDYNLPGAYSYEQAFSVMRQLNLPADSYEEQFRRMVFNIVARNQDDHVKNIAFLMDKTGLWTLSPAFDVTWSYNPSGLWTGSHQMSINGKRDQFTMEDFKECGRTALLKRGRSEEIVRSVIESVKKWPDFGMQAKIPESVIRSISKTHRLHFDGLQAQVF